MKLRTYQLTEQGIIARLKAEWIRSGTDLSFEEYLWVEKNDPEADLTVSNRGTVTANVSNFNLKRQVVLNLDRIDLMITYLIASVLGSISMHYIAMKYFEK